MALWTSALPLNCLALKKGVGGCRNLRDIFWFLVFRFLFYFECFSTSVLIKSSSLGWQVFLDWIRLLLPSLSGLVLMKKHMGSLKLNVTPPPLGPCAWGLHVTLLLWFCFSCLLTLITGKALTIRIKWRQWPACFLSLVQPWSDCWAGNKVMRKRNGQKRPWML